MLARGRSVVGAAPGYCSWVAAQSKTSIRTDIQALRALAVLAVLLNHLWPEHLPGGFIGVDVFFVISGYLITAHLFREKERTGRIALGSFWARRAKRLLPAALLVLFVSAVIAVALIPEPTRANNLIQVGWAALYSLNWVLAAESVDYFAQEASQTLVVHYWSLSVEEQFYLVWPVLLVLAFALGKSVFKARQKTVVLWTLAIIAVASLTYAMWGVESRPEAVYFETTARAWEFAVGGLIAALPSLSATWKIRLTPVVWLGWVALIASLLILDGTSGVPGAAALLPVLATAAIILIGETKGAFSTTRLTALRPVQWVGDISYSAYLWHFPLLVGAPFLLGTWLSAVDKIVILGITLVLSAATKRFVEDPIRFKTLAKIPPRAILAGTLATMVVVGGGFVGGANFAQAQAAAATETMLAEAQAAGPECFGAQAALSGADCPASHMLASPDYLNASPEETLNEDDAELGALACENERHGEGVLRVCQDTFSASGTQPEVMLIGDSHLMAWRDAIRTTAQDLDMHLSTSFKPGCPPSLNLDLYAKAGADREECENWKAPAIHEIAEDPDIDIVVTSAWAASYTSHAGEPDDGSGYVEAWQLWLDAGKYVVVLQDTPRLRGAIVDCIMKDGVESIDPCSQPRDDAVQADVFGKAAAQIDNDKFAMVDYTDVFCDDRCHAVIGGIPAYRDSNHVSLPLTRSFGADALRSEFEDVIAREAGAQ